MTLSETTQEIQKYIQEHKTFSDIQNKEITNIYQKLIDCLVDHNHLYYIENKPIISDYEYDQLFNFLKKIEEHYPYLISSESPTQSLIWQVQDWFNQAEHKIALLSLENTYNSKDLEERNNRINKIIEKTENWNYPKEIFFVIEPKFDGISVEIIYKDGKLNQAITRWDGKTGDDITINVKTIKNLPKIINNKSEIHVRWEIMMPKSKRKEINTEKEKRWDTPFANTRNATAWSIKLLDSNEVKKRELVCYLYDILYIQGNNTNITLENLWLPIFPRKKKVNENTMSGTNRFMAIKIAERSKRMGKNKGVSDLIIMLPNKILFIEMKRAKTVLKSGKLSTEELVKPEQYEFKNIVNSFSYAKGFIAYGCNEAIEIVENELKEKWWK